MKTRASKILALTKWLSLLLLLALPAVAQAQFTFTTNDDQITITGYIGSDGNVTIPGTTNGYPVTTIGASAFYLQSTLTGMIIPNSVTNIGDTAFFFCYGLTNVTIGTNSTSIGGGAFDYCYSLTSVTIPDSVTSIGGAAFGDCYGLTSVTIPDHVTSIGDGAFEDCSGLTNIAVSVGNASYASAGGVLYDNTLTTLIAYPAGLAGSYAISNNVTSIGGAAFFGSGLTSVTIPDSVTNIDDNAFLGSGLTNVTIGNGVISIGDDAFDECSGLTSVTIPDSVTSIGDYAFADCSSLQQAYFQGNAPAVEGGDGSVDGTVFSDDSGTAYYLQGATGWGDTFGGWPTVAQIIPPPADLTWTTNSGAITITGYTGSGGDVIIPYFINGAPVTSIGDEAFAEYGSDSFTSVTIPDSVTNIGVEAFFNCPSLTNVMIGNSVTSIGDDAFDECSGLTSVTIPDSVTSIGDDAFENCSGLTNITVSVGNTSYASAGGALYDNTLTMLIQCPNGLAGSYAIPDSVTTIGDEAFRYCYGLTSVTIGNSVASFGEDAFYYCSSLTNIMVEASNPAYSSLNGVLFDKAQVTIIEFPAGLSGNYTIPDSVTSIGVEAFYGSGLTSVTIPDSVTSIGEDAFYESSGLTSVTIGNSVTNIGGAAFGDCYDLRQAFFQGNAPSADISVFYPESAGVSGTAYYLPGTTGWISTFGGFSTAFWALPNPLILNNGLKFGPQNNQFGLTISWASNATVVVEACVNLAHPVWSPLSTNTLTTAIGTSTFSDSQWTNYPGRFYRLHAP